MVTGFYFLFIFYLLLLTLSTTHSQEQNGSLADSISELDDLILSSEKTPTLSPKHVTKKLEPQKIEQPPVEEALYQSDCSEPLNKDISCLVHIVDCSDQIFELVPPGKEPPGAHDVRIAPIAKVMGANRIDKREHRLHVDVSWQMPQRGNSRYLRAFKLHVSGPEDKETCFVFNVTNHSHDETVSPRYRFSSSTLFDFGNKYTVTISSLPRSANRSPKVSATAMMPDDPDMAPKGIKDQKEFCNGKSNPQASKWAASFRKIFLFSVVRMIQIEFLAAPPQYCFEEYEVRLLDSSGIVMLQSAIVRREDLKTEIINGRPVQFGEYNFTHLELDTDLIPSVIPIESAEDGRCLCETENGCSCLAADWKPVKLAKAEKPIVVNRTVPLEMNMNKLEDDSNWHVFAVMASISLLLLFCICICCVMGFYRKYEKSHKTIDVRFITDNPTFSNSGTAPLILKQRMSVLILYTHDCAQHEAAVLSFAELLRDVFHMDVHLDDWDDNDIEANRAEYVNSSIVRADKVIIINSIGVYHRVVARQMREAPLERVVPGPYDNLFISQIDLALQHVRIVSVHFSYTSSKYTLFALSPLLQFSIPDNLNLLISSIADSSARNDQLTAGFSAELSKLQAAVSRMTNFIENEPNWFERSHHRVMVVPAPKPVPAIPLIHSIDVPSKIDIEAKPCIESDSTPEIEMSLPSSMVYTKPIPITVEAVDEELESIAREDGGGDESSQLLDEDEEDEDNGYEYERNRQMDIMDSKQDQDDSGTFDSAFISGSNFSSQIYPENDKLDKTRISDDDCHNMKKHNRDAPVDSAFLDDVIGVH